jgi:hypothetical protein
MLLTHEQPSEDNRGAYRRKLWELRVLIFTITM